MRASPQQPSSGPSSTAEDMIMHERLIEATREATRRGLLRRTGEQRVLEAIGDVA